MGRTVEEALASAEAAGYRIDALLGPAPGAVEEPEVEAEAVEAVETEPEPEVVRVESVEEPIALEVESEPIVPEPTLTEPETPPVDGADDKTD
jgi:hypothetical protein